MADGGGTWRRRGRLHHLAQLIAHIVGALLQDLTKTAGRACSPSSPSPYHPLAPTMLAACSLQRAALAGCHTRQCSSRSPRAVVPQRRRTAAAPAASLQQREQQPQQHQLQQQQQAAPTSLASLAALWALAADLPAAAADVELSGGPPASSYYVSLGLFLITVPGAGRLQWRPCRSGGGAPLLGVAAHVRSAGASAPCTACAAPCSRCAGA